MSKRERQRKGKHRQTGRDRGDAGELIYGHHAAEAALRNPGREIRSVNATANALHKLEPVLAGRGIRIDPVPAARLSDRLGKDAVHQGILVETAPLPEPALTDILERYAASDEARPLIVLDQVTDPHNVGAVLRSAAVFGAAGLVMTRRHSPPLDGVTAKAASGAVDHVPVMRVPNLARAMEEIGDAGLVRIGLDSEAPQPLDGTALGGAAALVLGAEDKGLRRLTRESCDLLCRLETAGPIASLNVSNAAAIVLHASLQARNAARTG